MSSFKGYVVVNTHVDVAIFNTTGSGAAEAGSQGRAPRAIVAEAMATVGAAFYPSAAEEAGADGEEPAAESVDTSGTPPASASAPAPPPRAVGLGLSASNKRKSVVLALAGGVVVCYESTLPVHKPPVYEIGNLWTQPLFVVLIALVGVWQFYKSKNAMHGGGNGGGGGGGGVHDFASFMHTRGEKGTRSVSINGGRPGYDAFDPAAWRREYLAGKKK